MVFHGIHWDCLARKIIEQRKFRLKVKISLIEPKSLVLKSCLIVLRLILEHGYI